MDNINIITSLIEIEEEADGRIGAAETEKESLRLLIEREAGLRIAQIKLDAEKKAENYQKLREFESEREIAEITADTEIKIITTEAKYDMEREKLVAKMREAVLAAEA
ncbi:MAG: hypothetical protein FWE82_00610 [Defluviitaleaceae bacterium]|nr:hypothetical protein [Defluviitaleaceae bacterium]